jgi:hypothetical protein
MKRTECISLKSPPSILALGARSFVNRLGALAKGRKRKEIEIEIEGHLRPCRVTQLSSIFHFLMDIPYSLHHREENERAEGKRKKRNIGHPKLAEGRGNGLEGTMMGWAGTHHLNTRPTMIMIMAAILVSLHAYVPIFIFILAVLVLFVFDIRLGRIKLFVRTL